MVKEWKNGERINTFGNSELRLIEDVLQPTISYKCLNQKTQYYHNAIDWFKKHKDQTENQTRKRKGNKRIRS